jgi:hypothetical protein
MPIMKREGKEVSRGIEANVADTRTEGGETRGVSGGREFQSG